MFFSHLNLWKAIEAIDYIEYRKITNSSFQPSEKKKEIENKGEERRDEGGEWDEEREG